MDDSMQRILIADDDSSVCSVLGTILEKMDDGLQVVTVDNGENALTSIKEQHFDLLITDIKMPGKDGIELVREMRELEIETPVIVFTAFGSSKLHSDWESLKVYCCLEKPVTISEIREAARNALMENPRPENNLES
jgi:DNA-binding NtrC family response regulator